MKYEILITDSSGNKIADVSDRCLSRRYEKIRNRAGYIDLSFDLEDLDKYFGMIGMDIEDVFRTNVNEVHVYRNGTKLHSGQIQYINVLMEASRQVVEVHAVGWLELFASRFTAISQTYTAEDIGAIMWDLIDTTQSEANGDFGITQGTIQTSRDADRTYEYKNIKDAIIQLSEVINSPDFEFTANKVFNVYYPKQGIQRTDIAFTYPGNIISIGYSQDGAEMANQVIANGSGFGSERLLSVADNISNRPTYKLRQKIVQYPDVSIQATLDGHADEDLRTSVGLSNLPVVKIDGDVTPVLGSYGLGDEILLQATRHQDILEPVLGWQRIDAIKVDIDENDREVVDLRLSRI